MSEFPESGNWESGNHEVRKSEYQGNWKAGNQEIRKSGNQEIGKSENQDIRKSGNQEIRIWVMTNPSAPYQATLAAPIGSASPARTARLAGTNVMNTQ